MRDFADVTTSLEDVRTAIEDLRETVESVKSDLRHSVESVELAIERKSLLNPIVDWFLTSVVAGMLLGWVFSWIHDLGHSKWYIGLTHGVTSAQVDVADDFSECAFLAAPVGSKPCHYQRRTTTLRWARNYAGNPIQSFDEGTTWVEFSPPPGASVPATNTVEHVYVSWTKVDER